MLYGELPAYFKNEQELREIWSEPETRAHLLEGLADKGFGKEQMAEMQKIINAEKSDLFDVLAYVAYALPTVTRAERAAKAKVEITTRFTTKQQVFLDFVDQALFQVFPMAMCRELSCEFTAPNSDMSTSSFMGFKFTILLG